MMEFTLLLGIFCECLSLEETMAHQGLKNKNCFLSQIGRAWRVGPLKENQIHEGQGGSPGTKSKIKVIIDQKKKKNTIKVSENGRKKEGDLI